MKKKPLFIVLVYSTCTSLMFAISCPYRIPMKQIVPRHVDQFVTSIFQMTFRAIKKKHLSRGKQFTSLIISLLIPNGMLRFINMQVLHVHRVNRGEDIGSALYNTFSSLWQNYWCARG